MSWFECRHNWAWVRNIEGERKQSEWKCRYCGKVELRWYTVRMVK